MPSYELNLDLPDTEALSLFKIDAQEVTAKQSKTTEHSVCVRCIWWAVEHASPRPRNKKKLGLRWGLWGDEPESCQLSWKEMKPVGWARGRMGVLTGHTGDQRRTERSVSREPQNSVEPRVSTGFQIIKNPELFCTLIQYVLQSSLCLPLGFGKTRRINY